MMFRRALLILAWIVTPQLAAAQDPVWPKPDLFWYRKATAGGNLWLKVDAQYGVREPLFDHQRLAIELTLRSGVEYTPLTLPFADPATRFVVKYDGSNAYIQSGAMAIEFVLGGQYWRCDLQIKWNWNLVPPTDYECLARRPATPNDLAPRTDSTVRVSPDGRWEAFIQDHNVAIRAVGNTSTGVTILSSDGTSGFAYQPGSIRWSPDTKTLSAYRINELTWKSESISGNVKQHVVRGEWPAPRSDR